jgi:hypothetical protein
MNTKTSQVFWLLQRRIIKVLVGVGLILALVLLLEAVFVMVSGWEFSETVLGGRIKMPTAILFVFVALTSLSLLEKYADNYRAFRISFGLCVLIFSALACWLSVEFSF